MKKNLLFHYLYMGFLASGAVMIIPYIVDKNHVNEGKWHWSLQWLVVWTAVSILFFCIDRIKKRI